MPELPTELPEGHDLFFPLVLMTEFIAERVQPYGESLRATTDKVRKRLLYAAKIGRLRTVDTDLFSLPHVIAWSQEKWPGKFDDFHVERRKTIGSEASFSDEATCIVLPGNLKECQDALEVAQKQIHLLQTDLKAAHAEIECLKGFEKKYVNIREKNTESAKRPRKGGRIQLRSAPRLKETSKTCCGVRKPKRFRGRRLILSSIA